MRAHGIVLSLAFMLGLSETCPAARAMGTNVKPGDVAPPIEVTAVIQPPSVPVPDWKALHGKVVVLEFWATWCGPCVAALPHLNKLVAEFEDAPVEFISVSDEDAAHVLEFLRFRRVAGFIGVDTDKSMLEAYGAHLIPRTVLVDRDGVVRAITDPDHVDEKTIQAMLAGQLPELRTQQNAPASGAPVSGEASSLFRIELRPAVGTGSPSSHTTSLAADGWPLKAIIATAYDAPDTRIIWPKALPDTEYEFNVTVPWERKSELLPLARQALATTFGLKAHWEVRDTDVLVLTPPMTGFARFLRPAEERGPQKEYRGCVLSHGITTSRFAQLLESATNQVVIDETGMKGLFDVSLYWDPEKPGSLQDSIRDELGLGIESTRRPVRMLIIDEFNTP